MGPNIKQLVAIVGRPNVGKSTLFNRLVGLRTAIVSEVAGTTRDRVAAETVWADHSFILVDTGGLDLFPDTDMWQKVKAQVEIAIEEADVIVMLVEASTGITVADRDVSDSLRTAGKPVVLAANKADNEWRHSAAVEFYELGLGDPIPISAYHNLSIDDLMAQVISHFPTEKQLPEPEADLKLAIVGRTNVGKSMLLNAVVGQERSIVSETPGTTRDSLDTLVSLGDTSVLLIDTAGIRRRGSIEPGIERYSVLRSIRAIDRADVVILLMDASELATGQDTHVASYILDAHKGVVLAVNKWDLAGDLGLDQEKAIMSIKARFKFASYAPTLFLSALNGSGIGDLLRSAESVFGEWTKEVPRYDLRRTVMSAIAKSPPPSSGRHSVKIFSVAQDQTGPPSFTFYVNRPDKVHFSYQRYLENALRAKYQFDGSPLRIRFRGRGPR